jgi:CHAT domain-containing protein/Flp pilus assembly protein TadD
MVRLSWLGMVLAIATLSPVLVPEGAIAVPRVMAQGQADEVDRAIDEGLRLFEKGDKESLEQAKKQFELALRLSQRNFRQEQQAFSLLMLGRIYDSLGEKQKALDYYNQALPLFRAVGNKSGEATTLNNIGLVYDSLGEKQKALDYYDQALSLFRAVGNKSGEATTLNNIGRVYDSLGEKQKALDYFNQALPLRRAVRDKPGEATTLNNIGLVYADLGKKQKALDYFNQALPLFRAVRNKSGEATTLNNIGRVYDDLGEKQKALDYFNQALPLRRAVGDKSEEATTLNNIGFVYDSLGEKQKALDYFNQALPLFRAVRNKSGEAKTLNNIGRVYDSLGEKQKALDYFNQALPLRRAVGDKSGEAKTLNNIGSIYADLGEKQKALDHYNQALPLARVVDDRSIQAVALRNIGSLFGQQNQIDRAIAFYKQSVSIYETLRTDISSLSRQEQSRYTQTIAGTYRNLARLLTQQGRLSEAQQVLELLKIRELKDLELKQKSNEKQIIAISKTEKQAIDQINPEIAQEIKPQTLPPADRLSSHPLNQSAQSLLNAQPNSALIYHLLTNDKLWILLITPDGKIQKFASADNKKAIESLTQQFRDQIKQCENRSCGQSDTKALNNISQKLYQQLFPQDLQTALQQANPKHLTFALDGSLRNLPIATLHNGKQYLIEQYSISNIIAAQLTDSKDKLPNRPNILAFGVSNDAKIPVPADISKDREDKYPALKYVSLELAAILKRDPRPFLDSSFNLKNLKNQLPQHNILHLATHGIFRPNHLNYSYLLLGNNQIWNIPTIDQTLPDRLRQIHLVTLSACETGIGDKDSTGMEIAGISHAFMSQGAKSVLASLWQISDPSTALFMQRFYTHLANGKTKAQAIQQVQKDFITGKLTPTEAATLRAEISASTDTRAIAPGPASPPDYAHPFYWAPFILIGNNL